MNKITIYLKPAKGFDNITKKTGVELAIDGIKEVLEACGWKFKIVENDKFETESEDWNGI